MRTYIYTSISKAPNFVRFWPQLRNHKAIARQQSQTWNSRRRPWPCCKQGSIWIHPNAKKKHQISHQRRSIGIFGMNLALSIFFFYTPVCCCHLNERNDHRLDGILWCRQYNLREAHRTVAQLKESSHGEFGLISGGINAVYPYMYIYIWYIIPSRKCRPFQGMRWRNKDPLKQSGT